LEKDTNTADLTQTAPPISLAAEQKPFKSAGYKLHNEITYRGVDWFLNSTLGVTIAYWSQRTEQGQRMFGKPLASFFEGITKNFSKNPHTIAEGGKWGSTIISIIIGGMAIIPVMMGLENKKTKKAMIKGFDEKIYGAEAVKNDPKFQAQYDAIDQEPEKDLISGNLARALVLAPMIASTQIPALQKTGEKLIYDPLGKASKYAAESIGIKPKKMLHVGKDGQNDWNFLHQTIGFDFGLTFIYSFLHEYAYKAIAAVRHKDEIPAPAVQAPQVQEAKAPEEKQESFAHKIHRAEKPKKHEGFAQHVSTETNHAMAL